MSTPTRILYASQNAFIFPNSGDYISGGQAIWSSPGVTGTGYALALNSVSLDVTNPVEDVLTFGTLGSAARLQKETSKVKIAVKSYLTQGVPGDWTGVGNFDAAAISTLTGNSLAGQYAKVVVEPYGFTGYGVLTNLGLEATTNNFVMLDLSFEGVGSPDFGGYVTQMTSNAYTGTLPLITGVTPIISEWVGAGFLTDAVLSGQAGSNITATGLSPCASSAKFTLDIPMDTITCLGASVTGSQAQVALGNVMVGKPPFKTSIVVEGTAASACNAVDFGTVLVSLPNGRITSQSINQAVGNIGQTYNYTVEDITASFNNSSFTAAGEPDLQVD